jgi:hypothetical protein
MMHRQEKQIAKQDIHHPKNENMIPLHESMKRQMTDSNDKGM